jgi:hypothetical protein
MEPQRGGQGPIWAAEPYDDDAFIFHYFNFSSTKRKHAQTRRHTYLRNYSNDFDLRKIRVTHNLQQRKDCVTRGAPVFRANQNKITQLIDIINLSASVNMCFSSYHVETQLPLSQIFPNAESQMQMGRFHTLTFTFKQ